MSRMSEHLRLFSPVQVVLDDGSCRGSQTQATNEGVEASFTGFVAFGIGKIKSPIDKKALNSIDR